MRELNRRRRPFIVRDDHPKMISVDITDPDGDFEELPRFTPPQQTRNQPLRQPPTASAAKDPTEMSAEDEKAIEVEESMMKLFDQGLISGQELADMMAILRGEEVGPPLQEQQQQRPISPGSPPYSQQLRTNFNYANSFNYGNSNGGENEIPEPPPPSEEFSVFPDTDAILDQTRGGPVNPPSSYMSFELGPAPPSRSPPPPPPPPPPVPSSAPFTRFNQPIRSRPVAPPPPPPEADIGGSRPFPPERSFIDFRMGNLRPRPVVLPNSPPPPQPPSPPLITRPISHRLPPPPPPPRDSKSPSVHELAHSKTNDELDGDSFEDIFNSLRIMGGHGFESAPAPSPEDIGRGPHYAVAYPHQRQREELEIRPAPRAIDGHFSRGKPVTEAMVEQFLEDPPPHPYFGSHYAYGQKTVDDAGIVPPSAGFAPSDRDTFIGRLIDTPPTGLPPPNASSTPPSPTRPTRKSSKVSKERRAADFSGAGGGGGGGGDSSR